MKPTLLLLLDTRSKKKDDKFPLKLRIIFNRKVKYYATGYDMTEDEWKALASGEKLKKDQKEVKETVIGFQGKAQTIIRNMRIFSFASFEKHFFEVRNTNGSLENLYEDYIAELKKEERIGTASSYQCSLNSLKEFKPKLNLEDITVDFLKQYEKWMLKEENSLTTVGIYLRPLRALFNVAISAGLASQESYPFGKKRYEIPSGRNIKKALTIADVGKIFNYGAIPGTTMDKAKDFWLFTYFCNGINMKDIALLQYKNLNGDFINFVRSKTEHTTRGNSRAISVYVNDEAKTIIQKWGNSDIAPGNYIFPILTKEMTAEKQYAAIQQFTKTVNKYMDLIAKELKLEKHVTTYTARHTFSTVLKRSGASTEFISEALGHSNKKTTESYLDSFEQDAQKEMAKKLLAFT